MSPSADDSLFGDAADDTEAAVADEQDAGDETGSSEDLKVVVSVKGGRATIGVQQPSSDPYIESFDDRDLSGLTQEVSAVIERGEGQVGGGTQASGARETRSPRPGASPGVRKVRRRPGPPRERRSNSSRRR